MCYIPELINVTILTKHRQNLQCLCIQAQLTVFLSIMLHNVILLKHKFELISILYSSVVCNCSVVLES